MSLRRTGAGAAATAVFPFSLFVGWLVGRPTGWLVCWLTGLLAWKPVQPTIGSGCSLFLGVETSRACAHSTRVSIGYLVLKLASRLWPSVRSCSSSPPLSSSCLSSFSRSSTTNPNSRKNGGHQEEDAGDEVGEGQRCRPSRCRRATIQGSRSSCREGSSSCLSCRRVASLRLCDCIPLPLRVDIIDQKEAALQSTSGELGFRPGLPIDHPRRSMCFRPLSCCSVLCVHACRITTKP